MTYLSVRLQGYVKIQYTELTKPPDESSNRNSCARGNHKQAAETLTSHVVW